MHTFITQAGIDFPRHVQRRGRKRFREEAQHFILHKNGKRNKLVNAERKGSSSGLEKKSESYFHDAIKRTTETFSTPQRWKRAQWKNDVTKYKHERNCAGKLDEAAQCADINVQFAKAVSHHGNGLRGYKMDLGRRKKKSSSHECVVAVEKLMWNGGNGDDGDVKELGTRHKNDRFTVSWDWYCTLWAVVACGFTVTPTRLWGEKKKKSNIFQHVSYSNREICYQKRLDWIYISKYPKNIKKSYCFYASCYQCLYTLHIYLYCIFKCSLISHFYCFLFTWTGSFLL